MKNKDKTIALTLLALLLYALFVWHGMTYDSSRPSRLMAALESVTVSTQPAAVPAAAPSVYNAAGTGPSGYLNTLGLTVYTDAEFSSLGGSGRIFGNKPKMTLLAYMPTPQGDAIVWHDGREGYVCIDFLGILTDSESSLKQTYMDMCGLYDFELYIAGNESRSIAYAPKSATIDAYKKQTGKTFDHIYSSMKQFLTYVARL